METNKKSVSAPSKDSPKEEGGEGEGKKNEGDDKRKSEMEELKKKCDEYLNGWKRERADFLNYKKDEMERIEGILKYANEELILKILPILDSVYLAEKHLPEELKNNNWIEGFRQIKNQFEDFLKKEGVESLETVGKPFDPNTMEAIDEIKNNKEHIASETTSGVETVVEEVQRGYTLHGKVIRPAKVRVTKQKN